MSQEIKNIQISSKPIQVLFVGCTHGDELIGNYIFNNFPYGSSLDNQIEFKTILANPQAATLNKRFVDQDLNRSFPGIKDGNYEQNRAFDLMKEFANYDFVIDFHQTFSKMEDCIFITEKSPIILNLISYFSTPHVIILSSGYENGRTTITDNSKGFAIEYSRKASFQEDCENAKKDIENLIKKERKYEEKIYYTMLGRVTNQQKQEHHFKFQAWQALNEEQKTLLGYQSNQDIYPIFIGEKAYIGVYCILVEKVN